MPPRSSSCWRARWSAFYSSTCRGRCAGDHRTFMGDAGSMVLGFAVAWFSVSLTQHHVDAVSPPTMLWVLGLLLMDVFTVTVRRLARRRSPMAPDRDHIHHMLMRRGYSHRGRHSVMLVGANTFLAAIGTAIWRTRRCRWLDLLVVPFGMRELLRAVLHAVPALSIARRRRASDDDDDLSGSASDRVTGLAGKVHRRGHEPLLRPAIEATAFVAIRERLIGRHDERDRIRQLDFPAGATRHRTQMIEHLGFKDITSDHCERGGGLVGRRLLDDVRHSRSPAVDRAHC